MQSLAEEEREAEYKHSASNASNIGNLVGSAPRSDVGRSARLLSTTEARTEEEWASMVALFLRSLGETLRQFLLSSGGGHECSGSAHWSTLITPIQVANEHLLLVTDRIHMHTPLAKA